MSNTDDAAHEGNDARPPDPPATPPPATPTPRSGGYAEVSQAATALVLSILNFVICPVLGPVAWWMAQQEVAAINAGRRPPENLSTANAARIVGIIGTVFLALVVMALVGLLVLFLIGVVRWGAYDGFR